MKRGQIAIEYLSIMSFAVIVAAAFLVIALSSQQEIALDAAGDEVDVLAALIQNELVVASSVRSGYSKSFYLPEKISGVPIIYDSYGNILSVRASGAEAIRRVPAFSGNLTGGDNVVSQIDGVLMVS